MKIHVGQGICVRIHVERGRMCEEGSRAQDACLVDCNTDGSPMRERSSC